MKYLIVVLFIAASTLAEAQDEIKYKLNPDSLAAAPAPKRVNLKINEPLFILDDKEISSHEVQNLDPNTIESIQVLKDSVSITPYGKKGRGGVIIIASKPRKKN